MRSLLFMIGSLVLFSCNRESEPMNMFIGNYFTYSNGGSVELSCDNLLPTEQPEIITITSDSIKVTNYCQDYVTFQSSYEFISNLFLIQRDGLVLFELEIIDYGNGEYKMYRCYPDYVTCNYKLAKKIN